MMHHPKHRRDDAHSVGKIACESELTARTFVAAIGFPSNPPSLPPLPSGATGLQAAFREGRRVSTEASQERRETLWYGALIESDLRRGG